MHGAIAKLILMSEKSLFVKKNLKKSGLLWPRERMIQSDLIGNTENIASRCGRCDAHE